MSIAIQRIKRAISDMPTGGMRTGKQHIKLEYSDSQRAIAEIEGLTAERDALAAQVEALRKVLEYADNKLYILTHNRKDVSSRLIGDADKAFKVVRDTLAKSPAACLAQVRAEAVMDFAKEVAETGELSFSASDFVADFANQYAESIRQEVR